MMNFQTLQTLDSQYIMNTYGRFPVDLLRGEGCALYDASGKRYIDFTSGIGVTALGHGDAAWVQAVSEQAAMLAHVSNLYYTEPQVTLAQTLCQRSGMSRVFFANSGAEANEGMMKLARKYSCDKYGPERGGIVTLNQSFHGRTAAALSATGQDVFHDFFFPFPGGFSYADPNMESIRETVKGDTCAVMLELIQGEGGVNPMDKSFIHDLAIFCAERDVLLLIDEVQTGIGRTGSLFAFQQYGIIPDVCSFAKGVGGGLPLGGFFANEKCKNVLGKSNHGTTFGGNPICCAGANVVMERMSDDFLEAVAEKGKYLRNGIEALELPCFGATKGMGLMIGIAVKEGYSNREIVEKLNEKGLLCLTAGPVVRLLPPLTITQEEMNEGIQIMKETLA